MNIEGQQSNPNASTLQELQAMKSGQPLPTGEQDSLGEDGAAPLEAEAQHQSSDAPLEATRQNEAPPEGGVIVDGKSFSTEAEAYTYVQEKAKQLETENLLLQARQEGFEAASQGFAPQSQVPAPAVAEVPEDDSDEFYADPQGYFQKKMQSMRQQIQSELQQATAAQQAEEQLWGEFFSAHPDLEGFKADCEQMAGVHAETIKLLAAKDKKKALDFLATKTRAKFQDYMERIKPRTNLPRQQNAVSVGNAVAGPGVTPPQKEDAGLDFVSQMRNMRSR